MLRGVRMGILDEKVAENALRAWHALRDGIDERGIVLEASKGTMVGPDLQYYCDIAMAPVPYAQALMMLLLPGTSAGEMAVVTTTAQRFG